LLPELFAAWDDVGSYDVLVPYVGDAALAQAVEALRAWDGAMDPDSYAALVYKLWSVRLTRDVVGDELGFLFEPIDSEKPATTIKYMLLAFERDDDALLDGDRRVLSLEALRQALAVITARGLSVLGDLHQTRYIALDDTLEYAPRAGGDSTVNVAESRCWADGELAERCEAPSGAVYRTITTFREDGWPETRFNWPRGNAGEPGDWDEGVYRRWWFAPGEVEAHAVSEYTLEPDPRALTPRTRARNGRRARS
jgi:hypothetical protein